MSNRNDLSKATDNDSYIDGAYAVAWIDKDNSRGQWAHFSESRLCLNIFSHCLDYAKEIAAGMKAQHQLVPMYFIDMTLENLTLQ